MYFHGLEDVATQVSRVAISHSGIDFEAQPETVGCAYRLCHPNVVPMKTSEPSD